MDEPASDERYHLLTSKPFTCDQCGKERVVYETPYGFLCFQDLKKMKQLEHSSSN